jgi:hypothetical protein
MRVDRKKFLVAATALAGAYAVSSTSSAVTPTGDGASPTTSGEDGECRGRAVPRPTVCDDGRGSPGDCRKADCRRTPFICQHCEDYKAYFKPKIAERAVACVVSQTGAQLQDGCRTYACGDEALKGACLDPLADPACWAISRACTTTLDECRGLLSGMNDAGRQKVLACAMSGCRYGLWSCVEGL